MLGPLCRITIILFPLHEYNDVFELESARAEEYLPQLLNVSRWTILKKYSNFKYQKDQRWCSQERKTNLPRNIYQNLDMDGSRHCRLNIFHVALFNSLSFPFMLQFIFHFGLEIRLYQEIKSWWFTILSACINDNQSLGYFPSVCICTKKTIGNTTLQFMSVPVNGAYLSLQDWQKLFYCVNKTYRNA